MSSLKHARLVAALIIGTLAQPAWAEFSWRVASPAEIERILPAAQQGDVFELAPGAWGPLSLRDIQGLGPTPLVLRAQDPLDPPILSGLDLSNAANLRIEGVRVELEGPGLAIDLTGAQDITLDAISLQGQRSGTGFDVSASQRVTIAHATVEGLGTGITGSEPRHLTVTQTEMTGLSGGAIALTGGAWLTIEDSQFHRFAPELEWPQRRIPNMVHIGPGDSIPSFVLIKDTLVDSGDGPPRPGVILGDYLEGQPDRPPLQEITLSGNVIVTPTRDGIVLGPTTGAQILSNAVLRPRLGRYATGPTHDTTPTIRLSDRSESVGIERNWAALLPSGAGRATWQVRDNETAQDTYPGQADHYDMIFAEPGNPDPLQAYVARPGGKLDRANTGPGMLRQALPIAAETVAQTSGGATPKEQVFLTYDPTRGEIIAPGAEGGARRTLDVDRGAIPLGGAFPLWEINRDMVAPIFDARDFTLRLRLRGRPGRRNGGEVLRIHPWLVLNVDHGGAPVLHMRSAESTWKKLTLRTARINEDAWRDVEIHFDTRTNDGVLRLSTPDGLASEVAIYGPTPPMRVWELNLGNPFGDRITWEGEIGGLTLLRRFDP